MVPGLSAKGWKAYDRQLDNPGRLAIEHHSFQVELNGLTDEPPNLFEIFADGDTSWKVGDVGSVASFPFLKYYRIVSRHFCLISNQLAQECYLEYLAARPQIACLPPLLSLASQGV